MLVKCGNEALVLAEGLYKGLMSLCGIEDYSVLGNCLGSELEGLKLQHPFYQRVVPIILGDHVTLEAGTGAVHTAPGHGQDDYAVGLRYGLEVDNPVGDNGCFLPNTELFAGEHVFKANASVLSVLEEQGSLITSGNTTTQLPSLLAPQDTDYFSCYTTMVYQYGWQWSTPSKR